MTKKDLKSNFASTSYRSCSSRSCTIRVVVVGRVAHPSGPSRCRAVCVVEVGRVAHRRGPSRRRAVGVVVVCRVAHRRGHSRRRAVGVVVVGRVTHRRGPSRRRTVRVVEVGRVAHPVGCSPRGAISTPVLRPLRLRHVRTGKNGDGCHDSDCCFLFHFTFYRNRSSFLDCAARASSRDLGLTNVSHLTSSLSIWSNVPYAPKTSDLKASPHDT